MCGLLAVVQAIALLAEDEGTALACLSAGFGASVLLVEAGVPPGQGGTAVQAPGDVPGDVLSLWVDDAALSDPVRAALGTFVAAVNAGRIRAKDLLAAADTTLARLQRREVLQRNLFDLSPTGILLINAYSGLIVEANAAFLGFGNWSREAVVGHDVVDLLPPADRHVLANALSQLATSLRFGPIEHAFSRAEGGSFPAVVRGIQIESGLGKRMVWVLVEDVSTAYADSARIRAAHDEAVRARAELDTAVQALPHGFVLFDAADRVVMVNEQMQAIYPELAPFFVPGRTYGDIMRAATAQGVFPEAIGREASFLDEILGAWADESFERLTALKGGRVMRVLDRAIPDGGRVGLRIDVTNEHEVARRLHDVIEGAQAATWEADLITGENIINDRWAEMLGLRREDLGVVTGATWERMIHPDDRAEVLNSVARMIAGDVEQYEHSYRMGGVDGHWVWIIDRGRISAWAPDGTPTRMSGVHIDISAIKEAEERLETIIRGAEAGTWQYRVKTGENFVNERWAEIIGYTRAEITPLTYALWQSLVHPCDFATHLADQSQQFAAGDGLFNYELRLRHKDGHWVWVQSRGQVTAWDEAGAPMLMSGVHLDISARKKLEEDLKTERDFLATLTDTSVSGIMALDAEARIVFLNPEALAILEAPHEALIGLFCDPSTFGFSDLAGGAMRLEDLPCRRALAIGQTLRDIRLRLAMPDGRSKVLSINAAPLPDTGIEARVVCTITDITAAALAEDTLRAAMDRAEAANRAKSQFLANMSHELRTPLNGVLGMAELLADGPMDGRKGGQAASMVQTIREQGTLLLSILNDILDLSKIESGKLELEDGEFSFAALARRVETMHSLTAKAKGVRLVVHLGPGSDTPRRGDAQRLLQVLHNLVGNAVKFTETGHVDLKVRAKGALVTLVVCDTGIGMTPEQMAVVFDEFTQADGSITRRFGGTGLGLPIVRRLVTLMGGQIDLTSTPGVGTDVTLRLSLPELGSLPAPPPAATRPDFIGLRALVAEDNATNRVILRAMLGRLGIAAKMVQDGHEAVKAFEPGVFDLLLLDISMPHKDGMTALAEIRVKAGAMGAPPAIAVTANAMTHLVAGYIAGGFADVVAKPVQLDALAASIFQVCPPAARLRDLTVEAAPALIP